MKPLKNNSNTYSTHKVGKLTAVVCSIYNKSEKASDVNNILLRLMQTDIEKSDKKHFENSKPL